MDYNPVAMQKSGLGSGLLGIATTLRTYHMTWTPTVGRFTGTLVLGLRCIQTAEAARMERSTD